MAGPPRNIAIPNRWNISSHRVKPFFDSMNSWKEISGKLFHMVVRSQRTIGGRRFGLSSSPHAKFSWMKHWPYRSNQSELYTVRWISSFFSFHSTIIRPFSSIVNECGWMFMSMEGVSSNFCFVSWCTHFGHLQLSRNYNDKWEWSSIKLPMSVFKIFLKCTQTYLNVVTRLSSNITLADWWLPGTIETIRGLTSSWILNASYARSKQKQIRLWHYDF